MGCPNLSNVVQVPLGFRGAVLGLGLRSRGEKGCLGLGLFGVFSPFASEACRRTRLPSRHRGHATLKHFHAL